jgi:hypothetical protein
MAKQLKTRVHYFKVKRQQMATLLTVREFVLDELNKTYMSYECNSEEVLGCELPAGKYAQLIFVGDKGIPFSHLVDIGKLGFYKALVGEVFDIVTPSDSRKEWMRSKYGK